MPSNFTGTVEPALFRTLPATLANPIGAKRLFNSQPLTGTTSTQPALLRATGATVYLVQNKDSLYINISLDNVLLLGTERHYFEAEALFLRCRQ